MQFLCIYKPTRNDPPTPQLVADMGRFIENATKAGVLLATGGLHPSSLDARVRLSEGQLTVTDGPFIEAKELIGGFALIQTKTKAEVIEWTKRFLKVAGDGVSELRKVSEGPETQ